MDEPAADPPRRQDRSTRRRHDRLAQILLIAIGVGGAVLGLVVAAGSATGATSQVHTGYDEAVYVGASWLLRGGAVPYRDFVFVFPPGVLALLWPFTTVTSWFGGPALTVTAVRVAAALAGGLTAYLLGRTTARELGPAAGVIAAALFVTMPSVVVVDGSALQEPFVNLAVVAAVGMLTTRNSRASGRRAVVAGLLLGVAISIKLVAGLFALPLLLAGPFVRPVADRVRFAISTAIPLTVLGIVTVLIVGVQAPWDQAVRAQLLRPASIGGFDRVDTLLPLWHGQTAVLGFLSDVPRPWVVGALALACALAVCSRAAIARVAGLSALVVGGYLFLSASFFGHYTALVAPWLAVVVAWALTRVVGRVFRGSAGRAARAVVVAVVLVAFVGAGAQAALGLDEAPNGGPVPAASIRRALRDARCVRAVRPPTLLDENRVPAADRSGQVLLDVYGAALTASLDHTVSPKVGDRHTFGAWAVPFMQRTLRALPRNCDLLVVTDARCPEGAKDLTLRSGARLRAGSRLVGRQGCTLFLRPRR